MWFQHSPKIWAEFPQLVPVVAAVTAISVDADVDAAVQQFTARAAERLNGCTESGLPEIQAWRRAGTV
jgi:DNA/RNA-binding domain of Phe-tRNA-synthetase-like protein